MCNLPLIRPIGIHDPDFQRCWTNQILFEQTQIIAPLFFRLRMVGAIDDLLAVVRPEWPTVIPQFIGQTANMFTVGIHRIDVQITITHRGEDKLAVL